MPTLKFRFPGGRYHATPWGHHVNEGLIEWPPSPWRVLRALLACGYASQGWSETPPIAQRMIDKLAAVLPAYPLPPASAAHSRHFMPYVEGKNQKTTLVFDTWANVGDGEMFIHWPCEFDEDERSLLGQLAAALNYLGRSESWVEAELVVDKPNEFNVLPCQEGEPGGREWEQVALMAALPPAAYAHWREQQVEAALAAHPLPAGKKKPPVKLIRQREKAVAPYPENLLTCLTLDTAWWKGHGWSQPPGSRRVLYWRRSDMLQAGAPQVSRVNSTRPVEAYLLAISTPTGNRSALPPVARTVLQAEHLRRALIRRAANGERIECLSLLGRVDGQPVRGAHEHACFIPLDLDGDKHLDHILIYAKGKLCGVAQHAIRSLKRTWTKGGAGDLQLAIVVSGDRDAFRRLPRTLKPQMAKILGGSSNGSRCWRSVTPFVPPRFLKSAGKNTLEGQIQAELASRGFPEAASVEVVPELTSSLRHFVRRRHDGGGPPKMDMGYGVRMTFAKPIPGPILLGYASHYGLGLFEATDE